MTKNKPTPTRKPAFVTVEAHKVLPELCDIIAEEKQVTKYDYIDAISNAVIADYRRAIRRRDRRQQAQVTAEKMEV